MVTTHAGDFIFCCHIVCLYRFLFVLSLGRDDLAAVLRERLVPELRAWTNPAGCSAEAARCFFYDEQNHGLVGLVATFGSDEFNDHHFHYGYFLYAAALVGQDDPSLVPELAPIMTLITADIARPTPSENFPALRVRTTTPCPGIDSCLGLGLSQG